MIYLHVKVKTNMTRRIQYDYYKELTIKGKVNSYQMLVKITYEQEKSMYPSEGRTKTPNKGDTSRIIDKKQLYDHHVRIKIKRNM